MAAIGFSPTTYPIPNPVKLNGPDPRATVSQTTPPTISLQKIRQLLIL